MKKVWIAAAVGCGCLGMIFTGIVAAIFIPNYLGVLHKAKQKRTVADMREVGTAWMSWHADQGDGAGWTGGENPSAAELAAVLVPEYIQEVPVNDGWKHQIRYSVSSSKFAATPVFTITSPGRDGLFEDPPPKGNRPFPPGEYDYDIVWQDGYFISFPDGNVP